MRHKHSGYNKMEEQFDEIREQRDKQNALLTTHRKIGTQHAYVFVGAVLCFAFITLWLLIKMMLKLDTSAELLAVQVVCATVFVNLVASLMRKKLNLNQQRKVQSNISSLYDEYDKMKGDDHSER